MKNLDDAKFLLTPEAQETVNQLTTRHLDNRYVLSKLEQLRRSFTPERASSLITLAKLRQRASEFLPHADKLYFTRESLEQSTAWEIAKYRADWIHKQAPPGQLLDLGCGIGGDLLHLAQQRHVIAYEVDPVRACFAQANVDALGLTDRVEIHQSDWVSERQKGNLPQAAAAFIDPARRINGKRIFTVEQLLPSLSEILRLHTDVHCLCIKLMPGIQDSEIPANSHIKFISHQGTCKEAMLWIEPPGNNVPLSNRSAAIYAKNLWHEVDTTQHPPPQGDIEPGNHLHEPDPALIRAGAFWELCQEIDGWLLDPQIAYLVTRSAVNHPLLQSFRILEIHPFNLKKLNRRIGVLEIGRVELKKRGMPFEPESMRARLKLVPNGKPAVILFTRRYDERLMIISERVTFQSKE